MPQNKQMLSYTDEFRLGFYLRIIWKKAQELKYSKEQFLVYMLRTLVSLAFIGTVAPKSLRDAFLNPLHRPIIIKYCVYQISIYVSMRILLKISAVT